jgi:hypothetical protein
MKKVIVIILIFITSLSLYSCQKFLNVVPDKTGTLANAFTQRSKAKKFLYSIYHYIPLFGSWNGPVSSLGGDEVWIPPELYRDSYHGNLIARGLQNANNPVSNSWGGGGGAKNIYIGIQKANIFLKGIHTVVNMTEDEKRSWAAEAKFLKAYYYFLLVREYGAVVIYKKNLPVSAPSSIIKRSRAPMDSCFSYIIKLMNEVIHTPQLPARPANRQENLGRIDKAIAYTVKAQVEAFRASPLFNGNKSYEHFKNGKEKTILYSKYNSALWDSAAVAALQAINYVKDHGFHLYTFQNNTNLSDTTAQKLTIRKSFSLQTGLMRPNVIWPMTSSSTNSSQQYSIAPGLSYPSNKTYGLIAAPLKIAEMFYTNHGVPLKEDKSRDYSKLFELQKVGPSERFNLRLGYTTARLNFHREPRFYADLCFDGGIWFGQGDQTSFDDTPPTNLPSLSVKRGQHNAVRLGALGNYYNITGYYVKKLVNVKTATIKNSPSKLSIKPYFFPQYRIAYLYLLYAEAKNEADDHPGPLIYNALNKVRTHAGLPTVQDSWDNWSKTPDQYKTKEGLRKIIHREMLIEMAFDRKRFWMLRRWKEAKKYLNENITGWNVDQSEPDLYYQERVIFRQHFSKKDYLWPISESVLNQNPNLKQNPGW